MSILPTNDNSQFKILVDSAYGIALNTAANLSNVSRQFQFDFSKFPDGLYELTFIYVGVASNQIQNIYGAELNINFPFNHNYKADKINYYSSFVVGLIYPVPVFTSTTNTLGYLYAGTQDNPPTLLRKPRGQNFTVSILKYDNTQWLDTNNSQNAGYTLQLCFKRIAD